MLEGYGHAVSWMVRPCHSPASLTIGADVAFGSFATGPGQQHARPCPLWRRKRKEVRSISGTACFSPYLYRARNLVERFFNKIKQCRRVATRYDKLAANYLAFIKLASIQIWRRANEATP